MKNFKGKRTLLFAGAAGAMPLIDAIREVLGFILGTPELGAVIPAEYYPYYTLIVAVGTIIMRKLTTTAVGKSE